MYIYRYVYICISIDSTSKLYPFYTHVPARRSPHRHSSVGIDDFGRDLRQTTQIDQFPSNERFPTDGSLKWMIYICIEIISEVFPSKSP